MANYISENDIEQAILDKLNKAPFNYNIIKCPANADSKDNLNDGTGKTDKRQGVNNLMESFKKRKKLNGKLGVFWHTQGSSKSYSMVMFARKVKRKINGNFTFLIITDREDLDSQIHNNFVRTEVIGDKVECQPKNSSQLRDYLKTNKEFIFTLIQKS